MPLEVGTEQAKTGMAGAVFEALDAKLRPPLEEQLKKQPNMTPQKIEASIKESQNAWRKLSFALAQGIVTYLQRNPDNETEFAEAFSSSIEDPAFWKWLSDFVARLNTWASAPVTDPAADVKALKDSLKEFLSKDIPKEIKGVIR